jgi:glycosyltransferase involved in cell wall biosynthesis
LAQNFDGQAIIVVNDGSTDRTNAILAGYGARIQTISQPNQGFNRSRNIAIERASGKYIALLDADDIWLPGRLSKTVAALERNPAASLAFSDYMFISQSGSLVQSSAVPSAFAHAPSFDEMLTRRWPIAPTTVTMPRSTWQRCGGFPSEPTAFDLYLFIRAREFGDFKFIAEPLAKYRLAADETGPDKWSPDVFIKQIRQRYGARSHNLVAEVRNDYAGSYASRALQAMERGNRREAVRCWRKVFRYEPFYMFDLARVSRLFHRNNVKRLARMLRTNRAIKE